MELTVHQYLKFFWLLLVWREAQCPLATEANPGQGGAERGHGRDAGQPGNVHMSQVQP